MGRLVVDLCILIDLNNGNILHRLFGLESEIYISEIQLAEVDRERGLNPEQLIKYGIISTAHDPDEVKEVYRLAHNHSRKHIPDLFALVAAVRLKATLLTGDSKLRKLAMSKGIDCHGILWLLDTLIGSQIISRTEAFHALAEIRRNNSFLPEDQVNQRLKRWQP